MIEDNRKTNILAVREEHLERVSIRRFFETESGEVKDDVFCICK